MSLLPADFADLEPVAADWCLATEPERWEKRLASSMDELRGFHDAVFPRAEAAMAHLDTFSVHDLPDPETRLLQLLHSLVMVSYAVEVWQQQLPIDTGTARIDRTAEPRP